MFFRTHVRLALLFVISIVCLLAGSSCRQEPGIELHQVPKPHLVDPTLRAAADGTSPSPAATGKPTDRLLAALVPHGETAWFFKMAGPRERVAATADVFKQFVASVQFAAAPDAPPTWKLPEGWQREDGRGMRFATLRTSTPDGPLELTVIPLEMPQGDLQTYVLENVNRWRREMGLPPVGLAQLDQHIEQLDVAGRRATFVSLLGHWQGGMGRGGPFANPAAAGAGLPPGDALPPDDDAAGVVAGGGGRGYDPALLSCDPPDQWQPSAVGGMRKAAFRVEDNGKIAEITVISALGDIAANVNRWRQQVKLPPQTPAEIDDGVTEIPVGAAMGKYIEAIGPDDAEPREAILGVIVEAGGRTWFLKLRGPADLAEREKARFKAFASSMKFKS